MFTIPPSNYLIYLFDSEIALLLEKTYSILNHLTRDSSFPTGRIDDRYTPLVNIHIRLFLMVKGITFLPIHLE